MEAWTSGIVTGSQRKYFLRIHPDYPKTCFTYLGRGKYRMIGWESCINRAKWVE